MQQDKRHKANEPPNEEDSFAMPAAAISRFIMNDLPLRALPNTNVRFIGRSSSCDESKDEPISCDDEANNWRNELENEDIIR
jgi:hypothetical protein